MNTVPADYDILIRKLLLDSRGSISLASSFMGFYDLRFLNLISFLSLTYWPRNSCVKSTVRYSKDSAKIFFGYSRLNSFMTEYREESPWRSMRSLFLGFLASF